MDDEVKGEGNSVNYKYRMHDPRVGRFFAVDPLTKKYPQWSPYQFSGNQVIHTVELEGLEPKEDANDKKVGEFGQGSDKKSNKDVIYNWYVGVGEGGTKNWIKSDQYTKPEVAESAEMSNHVYSIDNPNVKVGSKAGKSDWVLEEKYIYDNYKAGLYSRTIDGVTSYSLAFAGTDDAQDGISDGIMGLGVVGSVEIARTGAVLNKVDNYLKGKNYNFVHYTGHSLGGGLASIASFSRGNKATTFNAMGIGWTIEYSHGFGYNSQQLKLINAYIINGEVLNVGQFSKADGQHHVLEAEGKYSTIKKHSIDRFLEMYRTKK